MWRGIQEYESTNYEESINHLERVVVLYPKKMIKFHIYLSIMYYRLGDINNSINHAMIAKEINSEHLYIEFLFNFIGHPELYQEV